jgi:hypothetical protein
MKTPSEEEMEEFLAAMEATGFRRARELAPLMLQFSLSDDSLALDAGG